MAQMRLDTPPLGKLTQRSHGAVGPANALAERSTHIRRFVPKRSQNEPAAS